MKIYTFFSRFILSLILFSSFLMMPSATLVQAADGDFVWAKRMGQTLDDIGYGIVVDSVGNVYSTGYFQGTVDFDPGAGMTTLSSAGNNDIFISKLDSTGNLVWARGLGSLYDDVGVGIFVDSAGNVYTTGSFGGTVDFDPGAAVFELTSVGSSDVFISKLDSRGNFVGAWAMGGTTDDYGNGVLVDSGGNIYTTGYFKNTVDFDPGGGSFFLTSEGVEDIFISKQDNSGNFVWVKAMGGAAADVGLGISLYSSGHIYTTGWFQGTVDFDPGTGPGEIFELTSSNGTYDIYISKLDSNGNFVWARAMGGPSEDVGQAVSVDAAGNVYSTGWFNGTVDFDPGDTGMFNLTSAGSGDIYISKLDSGGKFVWAKGMGGAFSDVGYGISVDSSGNVYSTGFFQGIADFDPGLGGGQVFERTSVGNADIYVSKLNSRGDFLWARAMGGTSDDYGYGVSVDSAGNVYSIGFFQGSADFDPGDGVVNLVSAGFEDIFISKLAGPDIFPWPMFLPAIINNSRP